MSAWSQTFTFLDGEWIEGNAPFIGARTHAFWLGSSVFDGARAFEGVTPDLDRHCARLNRSAKTMWLKPVMSEEAMVELANEGVKKFEPGSRTLYPSDVLGRTGRRDRGAARPGVDPFLSLRLRGAAAAADRNRHHPLALRQAARRHGADRGQGRLPLSEQRPRAARGALPRFRQLPALRHARQCGRARDRQCLHGEGRRSS